MGKITTQFGGDNAEHETKEMVEAMIRYMPIRTLRSFCGLTNKEIDEILEDLKKLV